MDRRDTATSVHNVLISSEPNICEKVCEQCDYTGKENSLAFPVNQQFLYNEDMDLLTHGSSFTKIYFIKCLRICYSKKNMYITKHRVNIFV